MTATKGQTMEDGRAYSDAPVDVLDAIYDEALGAVAQGMSREATVTALGDAYGTRATIADVEREADNAYRDAIRVGVDVDDTDDSWRAVGGRF